MRILSPEQIAKLSSLSDRRVFYVFPGGPETLDPSRSLFNLFGEEASVGWEGFWGTLMGRRGRFLVVYPVTTWTTGALDCYPEDCYFGGENRPKAPLHLRPHVCTHCLSDALILFNTIECARPGCRHYKADNERP